ncbi:MAG: hypothetical protein IJE91_00705 [Clostridia bacterium]|nr:hypothetical protein [Clostridia bacterium]
MTISTDIINNQTQLSLKVNKAVVDYIKRNRIQNGRVATIKTNELLNVAFQSVGIAGEILATPEAKVAISNSVKTCISVLEEVGAIEPASQTPHSFAEYLQLKKDSRALAHKPIHGKAFAYHAAPDFSRKVSALKTNEIIECSDVVGVDLDGHTVSVLAVKNVSFDKIKFCNDMFNYTKFADYIGCFNEETNKVDFVSTADERKVFFSSARQHVLPEKREIINLYYLVNLSDYKKLFAPEFEQTQVQTILSLRAATQTRSSLSTEKLSLANAHKYV